MIPFLVDMARLFELFVCEWLKKHLPFSLIIKAQERVPIGRDHDVHFDVDLVVYDTETGAVQCILDTKYKAPTATPASDDIAQVVAYAEAKNCREAILLYPAPLSKSFNAFVGKIRVRSLVFDLGGELEQAGRELLRDLLGFTEPDHLLSDQDKRVKGLQPDQANCLIA